MKIDEAIAELRQDLHDVGERKTVKLRAAQRLSIEALKRLQDNRHCPDFDHWVPLPGETEE